MRKIIITAVVALAALFATASPAEATLAIRLSTDGGSTFGAPITDATLPLSISGFFVAADSADAKTTATVGVASTLLDLAVSGGINPGAYNLVIQASVDGITTGPPIQTLIYAFTGSILPPGSGLTATMRSWIDDDNNLFGIAGTIVGDTGNNPVPSGGSLDFTAGAPYSVTAEIRITGTSSSHASLSLDNNNLITPAPAPAGLLLALSGGPALAVGAWLRRRRAAKVA